jgi:hypothetical protein
MPEYRNQHYVPQSYLRGWATDERIFGLHLPSSREFNESISDVCSRNYFYSETEFLEKKLCKLESAHAYAFKKLRNERSIRDLSPRHRCLLHSFVFTQRHRTKAMLDEIKEFGAEMWEEYVDEPAEEVDANPSDLADFQEARFDRNMRGIHQTMLVYGILSPFMIGDLEIDLLRNETETGFLTSDAPVVFANPRFRAEYDIRYAGMGTRGLQVYCPISPDLCVFIYDDAAYSTDGKRRQPLPLTATGDVKQLNMLQILNSNSVVFYKSGEREDSIAALRSEYEKYDSKKHIPLTYGIDDGNREYESELNNPVHDLDPNLDPVHLLRNVEHGLRPTVLEEEGKRYVHDLSARTDYSEAVIAAAIEKLLKNA